MSAFLIIVGLAVMVVAVGRLFGRMHWAHIANRRVAALVLAAGFVIAVAGGGIAGSNASQPASPAGSSPAPSSSPSTTSAFPNPSPSTPASPSAPPPSPSPSGTLAWQGNVALPDRTLTPGAVFAGATAAQVCTSGWAAAHRDVPDATRYAVFAEYGLSYRVHDAYEVDHLIPLELGGSNAIRNLWPQPHGTAQPGYPAKDRLENRLQELVCDGALALATAQHAIATNWWTAYQTYMSSPASPSAPAPAPRSSSPAPAPRGGLPVVHPGAFCSVEGARGVTSAGTPMVCRTTATDDRLRWRRAT